MSDRETDETEASFAADVRAGLLRAQKSLSPKYLYDPLGSALFEAITQLPEYGLWRAEQTIFTRYAEAIAENTGASNIVELGSGSATKTIHILRMLSRRQSLAYCTVDVSPTAIELTRRALDGVAGLSVRGVQDEYLPGLETALQSRAANSRVLVLFLGSSLGNFDAATSLQFLRRIRRSLVVGDDLLLGADLVKPLEQLLAAYDDALGVTAAFNLNLLVRMNRELGANFMLPQFRHLARFNAATSDVEMHIESRCAQEIYFAKDRYSVSFRAGETLHTESSHKYSVDEVSTLASDSGFRRIEHWVNEDWPFVTGLYRAI